MVIELICSHEFDFEGTDRFGGEHAFGTFPDAVLLKGNYIYNGMVRRKSAPSGNTGHHPGFPCLVINIVRYLSGGVIGASRRQRLRRVFEGTVVSKLPAPMSAEPKGSTMSEPLRQPQPSGVVPLELKEERDHINGQGASSNGTGRAGPQTFTVSQVPVPPFEKLANPGPLGLLGFAVTTFVLGLYECGAGLPDSNPEGSVGPDQAVFGLAIFMGGFAQFVAGLMEFRVGNTFGTTVHCSYGAFWLSYAMFLIPSLDIKGAYGNDAHAFSFAIGIYLIIWCFLTFLFLLAALRTNYTIIGVFFFLVLAFLFLSVANFISTTHPAVSVRVNKAGGAFTVVCAFIAFYAGASGLMLRETTFVRFPLGAVPREEEGV